MKGLPIGCEITQRRGAPGCDGREKKHPTTSTLDFDTRTCERIACRCIISGYHFCRSDFRYRKHSALSVQLRLEACGRRMPMVFARYIVNGIYILYLYVYVLCIHILHRPIRPRFESIRCVWLLGSFST